MAKFNLDDYVMVEDRIHAFRKKYPNGAITCELVAHSEDLTSVIIKSEVFDEEGKLLGSDLAQEQQGKNGMANNYSWVENAATSSIGRSLFNAGFAKKNEKKPSRQEMQKVATNEAAAKEPTTSNKLRMQQQLQKQQHKQHQGLAEPERCRGAGGGGPRLATAAAGLAAPHGCRYAVSSRMRLLPREETSGRQLSCVS